MATLELTPTWIMAAVSLGLIVVSLAAERGLHLVGKTLKKRNQKSLYNALLKVKEELMLLGFIPLLLAGIQPQIQKICIPLGWTDHMLPYRRPDEEAGKVGEFEYCQSKGKVSLLSLEAMQQLDNFIFVLAITHVIFTVSIRLLGGAKIHQWRHWEVDSHRYAAVDGSRFVTHVSQHQFIMARFKGFGIGSTILSWLHCFGKQFYGSVSKSDYFAMRTGFIKAHLSGTQPFDFHRYMMNALENDFKKIVGISWYLWAFAVIFLLLNVNGWHIFFWTSFLRLILVLAIGTKLEHVISQLAHDVAAKCTIIQGPVAVTPSDHHFWFGRPQIVLHLIHFIFFQNAFDIAFFFWVLTTYGFDSCMMGPVRFIVPRLVIGVVIQLLCSYSTLPLYAIVTQMGTCFRVEMFDMNLYTRSRALGERLRRSQGVGYGRPDRAMQAYLAEPSVGIEVATQAAVGDGDAVGNAQIEQVPTS